MQVEFPLRDPERRCQDESPVSATDGGRVRRGRIASITSRFGRVGQTTEALDRAWLKKMRVLYAALLFANISFAGLRGIGELTDRRPTGYWINLVGGAISVLLILWFEGAPRQRSRVVLHAGLGLVTLLLLGPTWYGYASSPWWLVIVPLAAASVMRLWETVMWGAVASVGMVLGLVVVPALSPYAAAGEPVPEGIASRVVLVVIVTGLGLGVRRAMELGADDLRTTQRTLEAANAELHAASAAKDVFLANISHEIRTPLGGVIGMTELALAGPLAPEAREQVRMAHGSARAALVIVNDILDISKIESGHLSLELTPIDLETTLRDALRPLLSQARMKGLAVACEVGPGVAKHRIADGTRIVQIVNNLVGNAIKFTAEGSVAIAVHATEGVAGGVSIDVTDTGIGIPPDKLDQVFEKFVQVDDSTTRRYGGTGLGLAIARELARLFGGDITVRSQLGAGSTFTARLVLPQAGPAGDVRLKLNQTRTQPTLEAVGPDGLPVADARPAGGRPTPLASAKLAAGATLKVLLAEDDSVSQLVLKQMLLRLGHTVTVAQDGLRAFEAYQSGAFDVLMSDLQMPGIDGIELTRRVRAHDATTGRHTLVFILSAHLMQADGAAFGDVGADAYLTKPVRLADLADALRGHAVVQTAD